MRRATGVGCLAAGLLATLGAACGEQPPSSDVREWTPADHVQPAGAPGDDEGRAAPPEAQEQGGEAGPAGQGRGDAAETPERQEARAAAALWSVSCMPCHGPGGRGDGPARPAGAPVADLTDAAWQRARTDEQIAAVIAQGRGMMPGFAEQVSPRGVAALVRHVRRLGGLDAAAGTATSGQGAAPGDGAASASR